MATNRILSALAAVSTSLFFAMGCAAGPDDAIENANNDPAAAGEEAPATTSDEEGDESAVNVSVNTDGTGTEATGLNCTCPAGQEFQNGLCYPACSSGYKGVGPVCWEICASTYYDTGTFCQRDPSILSANTSKCPWYNKCGFGSSCSKCPSGYSNDGCTCRRNASTYTKKSYGRGAGTVPACAQN